MRLDDQLMREAKALALQEGTTFTALIEDSLRERISRARNEPVRRSKVRLPVFHGSKVKEGVDPEIFKDNARLAEVMDELDGPARR